MANNVGASVTRTTVGSLAFGPDAGDSILIAVRAERGDSNYPHLITSLDKYRQTFGTTVTRSSGTPEYSQAYECLKRMFPQGRISKRVFAVRIVAAAADLATTILVDRDGVPVNTIRVEAKGEGAWANSLDIVIADGTVTNTFKISVLDGDGNELESYDNLFVNDEDLDKVTNASNYIRLVNLDSVTAAPNNRPATGTFNLGATAAGADGNDPDETEIVGTETMGVKTGLKVFRSDLFGEGFMLAPDFEHEHQDVRDEMLSSSAAHFRVLFTAPAAGQTPTQAAADRLNVSQYNTLFHYPRWRVVDEATRQTKTIPLSGHIIGQWLTALNDKGSGKPPAGKDFTPNLGLGLETQGNGMPLIDATVAEYLMANRVCPVWDKGNKGVRVLGAVSTGTDPAWRNIMAAYLYNKLGSRLQQRLDDETYEVTNPLFYQQLREGARALFISYYNEGAFSGTLPGPLDAEDEEHAFYIKADESLLSAQDRIDEIARVQAWFRPAGVAETIPIELARRV